MSYLALLFTMFLYLEHLPLPVFPYSAGDPWRWNQHMLLVRVTGNA